MSITNRPYIGTYALNNRGLVRHTPDAFLSTSRYPLDMPDTPEEKRRRKREWARKRKAKRPEGVWLRHHDYPEGFQVLCWNCNTAKKFGDCPHKGGV